MLLAASWCKRLGARLPPLGSRVRDSATPCGFRGGRNGVWVGFSRGFSRFPLPQISVHHFSTLISSISFHFISPCDGASGVVGRHPCYSHAYNLGASSHLIPRPDLVLDMSWGYLYLFYQSVVNINIIMKFLIGDKAFVSLCTLSHGVLLSLTYEDKDTSLTLCTLLYLVAKLDQWLTHLDPNFLPP